MRRCWFKMMLAGAAVAMGAGSAVVAGGAGAGAAAAVSVTQAGAWHKHAGGWHKHVGVWHKAIEVPGLAALNKGGYAGVSSVSCGSAGNCAAGGSYRDSPGHDQGFVVSERHGRWGRAIEVPGLAALNKGGTAEVRSVSCGSAACRGWQRPGSGVPAGARHRRQAEHPAG